MPEYTLQQRQELRQILTPKLIHTLKLLMLPKLELVAQLQNELMENPMLETSDDSFIDSVKVDEELNSWKKLYDGLAMYSTNLDYKDNVNVFDPLLIAHYQQTPFESLIQQLSYEISDPTTKKIGEFIIGNLDENGFLPLSLEQIQDEMKKNNINYSLDEIKKALKVVQSLSPSGIGARDLRECLLIQLEDMDLKNTVAYRIIDDYFDQLKTQSMHNLAELLEVNEEQILEAKEILSHLSFMPSEGRGLLAMQIEPDISVYKDKDNEWCIIYNDRGIPDLSINKNYQRLLKQANDLPDRTKSFLLKKLESARWWIDALQQRKATLKKTMIALLNTQKDFFENGPLNFKPLTMEKIAIEVGVHPATISRAVRGKFVLTPFGTFPLRKFFTTGLNSDNGDQVTPDYVKEKIRQMIKNEDKNSPLSDDQISSALKTMGINIARRTVAKYRNQMGILSARMRKV